MPSKSLKFQAPSYICASDVRTNHIDDQAMLLYLYANKRTGISQGHHHWVLLHTNFNSRNEMAAVGTLRQCLSCQRVITQRLLTFAIASEGSKSMIGIDMFKWGRLRTIGPSPRRSFAVVWNEPATKHISFSRHRPQIEMIAMRALYWI